ncbi:hypothetical protein SMD11_6295 [Streptomyces albireticuli]|uniref:Uncharacterized protein n=1 Tax=Streptomyces albireticuli TaxID=1940 RepID=A0A1Z2LCE3_9ACTN|nr:hypothetical protein SMD11_6295 [Streptomyces albireticuli]
MRGTGGAGPRPGGGRLPAADLSVVGLPDA